jgi:predicted membrane chloride channel (bestrophin family)
MALEEFEKEELNDREKGYIRMRSIMDFGMGVLWTGMGVFMIFIKKFSEDLAERYDSTAFKIFGVVCIIYGLFRVYRGYKKKYLRDR